MFEGIFLARTEDEQHPPPSPSAAPAKATTETAAPSPTPPPSTTTTTTKAQDGAKQDEGRTDSWTGRQWPSWKKNCKKEEGMKKTLEEGNRIWIRILAF